LLVFKPPESKQLATSDAILKVGRLILGQFKKQGLVVIVQGKDEDKKCRGAGDEGSSSEDPWGQTKHVQAEEELSKAGLVAPWAAKGNPPGFLDSEDEAELEETAWCEFKRKGH